MTLFNFLNGSGILTALVTCACIAATLWWLWLCSQHVGDLCRVCKEEMRRERAEPTILVQAAPDMTAAQLAELLREAEALLHTEQVA